MFNHIPLWDEPVDRLRSRADFTCEMSDYEQKFLCGLIQYKKPEKVLEIGVAEGGTTAVIYESLAMLDQDCRVYSVDISETLYYDNSKKTGYEFENLSTYLDQKERIQHQFLFGKTIGGQIDQIGKNIDLVILDTTHQLPGEILDFLCVLPYLSEEAMVILHDVNLNYIRAVYGNKRQTLLSDKCVATKLLFAVAAGKKFLASDFVNLSNIAGFQVLEDTKKQAENLFYLLSLNWSYVPAENEWKEYKAVFERYYDETCLKLFENALDNNRRVKGRKGLAEILSEEDFEMVKHQFPYDRLFHGCRIVLYGAGAVGREFYHLQEKRKDYDLVLWVDQKYEESKGVIQSPDRIKDCEFDFILVAVENRSVFEEIKNHILLKGWAKEESILGPVPAY